MTAYVIGLSCNFIFVEMFCHYSASSLQAFIDCDPGTHHFFFLFLPDNWTTLTTVRVNMVHRLCEYKLFNISQAQNEATVRLKFVN